MLRACLRWRETTGRLREYDQLVEARTRFSRPVTQPMCLISQVQRSGGTLLSQLFDGHPAVHAYPQELKLSKPKFRWPSLDLTADPEQWFTALRGDAMSAAFLNGYTKSELDVANREDSYPMLLPPQLRRSFFLGLAPQEASSQREVLDAFLTSFFYGWLDNRNLYAGDKEWVSAFTPRLIMEPGSVDAFFEDYPDGRMISIVRDPQSWYASARRMRPDLYGEVAEAGELWRRSTQSALDLADRGSDRLKVVMFTDLLERTADVMRELADWLGIDFLPELLVPTFNSMPIRASSSFPVTDYGVVSDPLGRRTQLSPEDRELITDQFVPLFDQAAARHSCGTSDRR